MAQGTDQRELESRSSVSFGRAREAIWRIALLLGRDDTLHDPFLQEERFPDLYTRMERFLLFLLFAASCLEEFHSLCLFIKML